VSGDIIYVFSGTYHETTIDISKSNLKLQGEDRETTIIYGDLKKGFVLNNINNIEITEFTVTHYSLGIIVESSSYNNIIANNNIISNNVTGIVIDTGAYNNTIISNYILLNRYYGVHLAFYSHNNTVINNHVSETSGTGIAIVHSSYNTITNNNVSSNSDYGIHLGISSHNNIVTSNNVSLNKFYGIFDTLNKLNRIYHNNIIDNTPHQAFDDTNVNFWNDTYPSGGNYWSDYSPTCQDLYSGAITPQTTGSPDEICDIQYDVDEDTADYYPLKYPYGEPPDEPYYPPVADAGPDQTVDEGDIVLLDGSRSKGGGGGGSWSIETVDSTGHLGYDTSIALDTNDYAHISYWDTSYDLKYARWTGSGWNMEIVDSSERVGSTTSIALDKNGYPHIGYYGYSSHDLKYARWTGSGWSIETVDSGHFTSIALDSNDYPHMSYFYGSLKYARWTGSAWSIETVDGVDLGHSTSIALDSNGYAHISYWDTSNYNLKYARWTGSTWIIETVDSAGFVGGCSSIALDSNGYAHISYLDSTHGDLKYAKWTGSKWSLATLDSVGWVGEATSITLDSSDQPHITYFDHSIFDLKYARWTGSAWSIETVDSAGDVGYFTSMALDSNDYAHISYWDNTNYYLKYARWSDGGGTIVSYEWDFTSDGSYDYVETNASAPDGAFDGKTTYVYGDNGNYTATLRVTDETGASDTDTVNINVNNVPPSIIDVKVIRPEIYGDVTLRLAGEKWHDVTMFLYEDETEIGNLTVIRSPGNPDEQSATIEDIHFNLTRNYSAKLIYTPEDDPINGQPNGATPAWIILKFENGNETRIHHTFNVKHPETWEWNVELNQYLMIVIEVEAIALDPGSDDLIFEWSFRVSNIHFNDGAGPDLNPSPDGIFPFMATDKVTYIYLGSNTVTLKVWDDDDGFVSMTISLS